MTWQECLTVWTCLGKVIPESQLQAFALSLVMLFLFLHLLVFPISSSDE